MLALGWKKILMTLIPANDVALKVGNPKAANMVMLAAYVAATDIVSFDSLEGMLDKKMGKKKDLLEINHRAFEEGRKLVGKIKVK